jgi:hypothetical protein
MKKFERIYIDMDGVAADFKSAFSHRYSDPHEFEITHGTEAFWEAVYEDPSFFFRMPPYGHLRELLNLCATHSEKAPIILSSPSRVNQPLCMLQKRMWIDKHIHPAYPAIFEKNKHKYAGPRKLLIDDYDKKVEAWRNAGGVAYHFKSFKGFRDFIETEES